MHISVYWTELELSFRFDIKVKQDKWKVEETEEFSGKTNSLLEVQTTCRASTKFIPEKYIFTFLNKPLLCYKENVGVK